MSGKLNLYEEIKKVEASEKSSIIYGILICVALASGVLYLSSKRMFKTSDAPPPPIGRLALYEPVLTFQKKHSRWPTNKEELQNFIIENKLNTTVNPYQTLIFTPEKDGSVRIKYAFKEVAGIERGSFTIEKP